MCLFCCDGIIRVQYIGTQQDESCELELGVDKDHDFCILNTTLSENNSF